MERNNEEVSDFDESESSSVASTRNTTEGTTTTTTENNDENISGIDMNKVVEMLYKHEQQLSTLATDDLAVTEDSTTVSTGSSSDINSRENNYENIKTEVNKKIEVLYTGQQPSDVDDLSTSDDSSTSTSTDSSSDSHSTEKICGNLKNTVDENGENHVKEEQLSSSNAHEDSSTPTRNTTDSEETESNCENVDAEDTEFFIKQEELSISDIDDVWAAQHTKRNTLDSESGSTCGNIETALVKKEELETTDDCTTVSTKINTTDSSSSDIAKKELVKEEVETSDDSGTPDSKRIDATNNSPLDNTKTELVKEEIETKEDSGKPVSPGINTIDNSLLDNMKKELVKEEVETRENSETPDSRRIKVTNTSPLDNVKNEEVKEENLLVSDVGVGAENTPEIKYENEEQVVNADDLNITISTEDSTDSDVTEKTSISHAKCMCHHDAASIFLNSFAARNAPKKRSRYCGVKLTFVNPHSPIYISSESESEDQLKTETMDVDKNVTQSGDSSSEDELEPLRF